MNTVIIVILKGWRKREEGRNMQSIGKIRTLIDNCGFRFL